MARPLFTQLEAFNPGEASAIIAAATSELQSDVSLTSPDNNPHDNRAHSGQLSGIRAEISGIRDQLRLPVASSSAPSPSQAIIAAATREMQTTAALSVGQSGRIAAKRPDPRLDEDETARQFLLAAVTAPPVHRPFADTRSFSVSRQRHDMDSFFDSLAAQEQKKRTNARQPSVIHSAAVKVAAARRLSQKKAVVSSATAHAASPGAAQESPAAAAASIVAAASRRAQAPTPAAAAQGAAAAAAPSEQARLIVPAAARPPVRPVAFVAG